MSGALGVQDAFRTPEQTEGSVSVEAVRAPEMRADTLPAEGEVRHLQLELEPPGLGACEVRLEMRDQALHAVVIAERMETVAALRDAEAQVRQALADQGLQVTDFDVQQGSAEGSGWSGRQTEVPAALPQFGAGWMMANGSEPDLRAARRPAWWAQPHYVDVFA